MIDQAHASTPGSEYPNVSYCEATAENLPFLRNESVDLVVAGQAAHWFDYPKLFLEMKRIVRRGGTLAFWGYKDCMFPNYPKATLVLNKYAYGDDKDLMGPYWSRPGRTIVEDKLRAIQPPEEDWSDVTRIEYEPGLKGPGSGEGTMFLQRKLKVVDLGDYIRTWSSFHGWQEAHPSATKRSKGGPGDLVDRIFEDIRVEEEDWQDEEMEIVIEWGSGLLMAKRQ
jgi:SAM-dependent methyltransferase